MKVGCMLYKILPEQDIVNANDDNNNVDEWVTALFSELSS